VVQGVGFRPFIANLARRLGLGGFVLNDPDGVLIEVEGERAEEFLARMLNEKPPLAIIYSYEVQELMPRGEREFRIERSRKGGAFRVWILPDIATCEECLEELFNPEDRRYRYPFINCTHCGPRFTIIKDLPYDRPNTTMAKFKMCPLCLAEYENPEDRRYHAQPNACPRCGPKVMLRYGEEYREGEEAIRRTEELIREGKIVAVKGLGGYHLIADARNDRALAELRRRKRRPYKPFAVMYPDVITLQRHVLLPEGAMDLLRSPQAPILILRRKPAADEELAPSVAPDSPYLGVFLPYTPLHHILLSDLGFPIVATSGNISDEPIEYREPEVFSRLEGIADAFLYHDRPIERHADDSVLIFTSSKPIPARRSRGYVPLPILAPTDVGEMLALGSHMNVTFAVSRGKEIILSQHFGDMDGLRVREMYVKNLRDFIRLYAVKPRAIAHDMHPDYFTTTLAHDLAEEWGLPTVAVQHHHAHMGALMLEYGITEEVIAFTWDGTGYGPDGTVWGGEVLVGDGRDFRRVATLYPFRLPGGERAVKEPWRIALALLFEAYDDIPDFPLPDVPETSLKAVIRMLERGNLSPITTSMGRLFDGIGALLGMVKVSTHQAEAPQRLEAAAWGSREPATLAPMPLIEREGLIYVDWRPLVREILARRLRGESVEDLAMGFHRVIVESFAPIREAYPNLRAVCGGGVFLNGILSPAMEERMGCLLPRLLPPTDGGLPAGQAWVASHLLRR